MGRVLTALRWRLRWWAQDARDNARWAAVALRWLLTDDDGEDPPPN